MSILISRDTRFIVQGITGREAVNLTRENLDYGAKIVGGVTPGRAGRDVYGVPVFDCVRDVVAAHGAVEMLLRRRWSFRPAPCTACAPCPTPARSTCWPFFHRSNPRCSCPTVVPTQNGSRLR